MARNAEFPDRMRVARARNLYTHNAIHPNCQAQGQSR